MADHHEDDLKPDQTEGFKVGEKKTLDEYHQLGKAYFYSTRKSGNISARIGLHGNMRLKQGCNWIALHIYPPWWNIMVEVYKCLGTAKRHRSWIRNNQYL